MTDNAVDQPVQPTLSLPDVLKQLISLAQANGASLAYIIRNRQIHVGTREPHTDSAREPLDPQDMYALRTPKLGLLIAFPDDTTVEADSTAVTTIYLNERDWFTAPDPTDEEDLV